MRRARTRRRQLRICIASCRIQLGLHQKDTVAEVSTAEVGASEVGPSKVGHSQVGTSEISSNEVCASQTGASEVRALKVSPDEVGTPVVLLVSDLNSDEIAYTRQQGVDLSPVC